MSRSETLLILGHQRMTVLLSEIDVLLCESDWDEALLRTDEFSNGLMSHMQAEEELLFPRLAQGSGEPAAELRTAHAQHSAIRDLLAGLTTATQQHDSALVRDLLSRLSALLTKHIDHETHAVYPLIEAQLGDVTGELATALSRDPGLAQYHRPPA